MSRFTISSKSLVESIRSSALPARVPHPASVVNSESEPFKDLVSLVDSDSDSFENSSNSDLSRTVLDTNSNPEELSEEDPSEDDPTDASFALYITLGACTMRGSRKSVRPQPTLPPAIKASITRRIAAPSPPSPPSSPSSSPPPPSPAHSGPFHKRSFPSPSPFAGPSRRI
ncbi:hypothetical protein Tco_1277401, partial [Tanacetum coccineum]